MLLFFCARGRFPHAAGEVDKDAVAELARTLGVPEPGHEAPLLPDAADRTLERQRAEIRALLGYREASVADAEALGAWLRDNAVARTRDPGELAAEAEARCRALRIEPPTPDRVARIVRAAVRAYEDRRHAAVHARLMLDMRARQAIKALVATLIMCGLLKAIPFSATVLGLVSLVLFGSGLYGALAFIFDIGELRTRSGPVVRAACHVLRQQASHGRCLRLLRRGGAGS